MIRLLRLPRPDGKRRKGDRFDISYRTAAARFHMIDDDHRAALLVPYDDTARDLIDRLRRDGPDRDLLRTLQPYTVPVSPKQLETLAETIGGLAVLRDPDRYRADVGLEVDPLKEDS
jgi:CRISPR-associated endonuclease/helicase Cas3